MKNKLFLSYGFYIAIVAILGLYLSSFVEPKSFMAGLIGILTKLVIVYLIYNGILEYFRQTNEPLTFGNIFKSGFLMSLVGAVLFAIFVYIFYEYLMPGFKESLIEQGIQHMKEQANLPEDQLEKSIETTKKYFSYFAMTGAFLDMIIVGTVTSILVGLWKRERTAE